MWARPLPFFVVVVLFFPSINLILLQRFKFFKFLGFGLRRKIFLMNKIANRRFRELSLIPAPMSGSSQLRVIPGDLTLFSDLNEYLHIAHIHTDINKN